MLFYSHQGIEPFFRIYSSHETTQIICVKKGSEPAYAGPLDAD